MITIIIKTIIIVIGYGTPFLNVYEIVTVKNKNIKSNYLCYKWTYTYNITQSLSHMF